MAAVSCLSLVDDEGPVITKLFDLAHPLDDDFDKRIDELRNDQTVQEIGLRALYGTDTSHQQLLKHLALVMTTCPRLRKVMFYQSDISNIFPLLIAAATEPFPTLEFSICRIFLDAAEDLKLFMTCGMLRGLIFDDCRFDTAANKTVFDGLSENQSLQTFINFCHPQEWYDSTVCLATLLKKNRKLETFGLLIEGGDRFYHDLFDAIEEGQSLKCLRIRSETTNFGPSNVERIVNKIVATRSIQELEFDRCPFRREEFMHLLQTLSRQEAVKILRFSQISTDWEDEETPEVLRQLVNLKIDRLVVDRSLELTVPVIQEIVDAGFIKHVELNSSTALNGFCDLFNRQTRLSALFVNLKPETHVDLNGGMESVWCNLNNDDIVELARQVGRMQGLRKLSIRQDLPGAVTPEFFSALAESLKSNKSLGKLSLHGFSTTEASVCNQLASIRRSLAINRVRGLRLTRHSVPLGLWPHLLEISSCDADGIFHVLLEKPDMFDPQHRAGVTAIIAAAADNNASDGKCDSLGDPSRWAKRARKG